MTAGRKVAAAQALCVLALCALAGCDTAGGSAPLNSVSPSPGKVLAMHEARETAEREKRAAVIKARAEAQAKAEAARKAREDAAAIRREKAANARMQQLAKATSQRQGLLAKRKAKVAAQEREAAIAAQRQAASKAAHEAAKAAIQVFPSKPGRPYTTIGPVRAVVTRLLPIEEAPSREKAIDALREAALKQGADGIIHVSVSEMHRVPMRGGGRTATGLAVLFPDPTPAAGGPAPLSAMRVAATPAPTPVRRPGPTPPPAPAQSIQVIEPSDESLLAPALE